MQNYLPIAHLLHGKAVAAHSLARQMKVQLAGGEPVQIGIGLVECQLWHDVFIICQHLGENLADKPVGMGVGITNAEHRAFMLMECGNPFQ